MAKKSSFFLAVLLIANPFMLLFFQNCSAVPQASSKGNSEHPQPKQAEATTKEVVFFHYK